MAWFMIVVLAIVLVLALVAVVALVAYVTDEAGLEHDRVDNEVRHAERRLHDIASRSFEAMLSEARSRDGLG